ncbi:PREDICTED: LEAF RUST 10 DISEASE-RESISTANCE LOCUS RECEPTOR-LIKE PROTEIN KINASE-like 2.4 [Camelina sativa]|uniref:LEAF RUST 10 DISEASE-RESISTANCE LOCUS RECEPTOR-LIKE PROTEIN KINASE-like 2.4 n=1 Tax=Camelina sativa TaxID=90675 RepID=A0ABM0T373_CAMSA|nr:PREDICTED: LEAF RUST 10 DISEASE-RESISTANCE LOCUS RECEPTOR-LIKE PROTEIN KINASE-like 2.4 [Camelina sativa]
MLRYRWPNMCILKFIFPLFSFVCLLLVLGVMSKNITVENKCDYTVWPRILTREGPLSDWTTGFYLKTGEARVLNATELYKFSIWGRTPCSTNATGRLSCATGDCDTGKFDCYGTHYPASLADFIIDESIDSYRVNLVGGFNLPLLVVPLTQKSSQYGSRCIVVDCDVVDLNQACPYELMVVDEEERTIACTNPSSTSSYSQNFKKACPTATTSDATDSTYWDWVCPSSTDYIITFCPSFSPIPTRRKRPTTEPSVTTKTENETTTGSKHKSPLKLKVILGVSTALLVMIIIVATTVAVRAKNARSKSDWNGDNIESVVMLKRYSYAKVKKMTNSFAHVLGKGGFGTVYRGKLPDGDGRDVAVKVLKELNGNGEEFVNEVASMSRTSHVNIVSLLGFCYEGSKKAIIYDFMPNGSLDKFISESMSTKMEWRTIYNIAEGVAHGLEYLHNRCVSRIVHFDIKPQNILVDEDLCPKISDFGLVKLCKKKDSIVSLLDARGTIGYIAPEVFSKNFGGVSHKSDVYSYGMVVLEIVGAKNRERPENSRSNNSSMYFPDWIYKDLEREETMGIFGDQITEEEDKIVKKMVLVGLWCIQTNPSDRPPMSKVVEMLEGSLEALHVPPKPLFGIPAVTFEEESQETSSFSTSSQLERGTLSRYQGTVEGGKDRSLNQTH